MEGEMKNKVQPKTSFFSKEVYVGNICLSLIASSVIPLLELQQRLLRIWSVGLGAHLPVFCLTTTKGISKGIPFFGASYRH